MMDTRFRGACINPENCGGCRYRGYPPAVCNVSNVIYDTAQQPHPNIDYIRVIKETCKALEAAGVSHETENNVLNFLILRAAAKHQIDAHPSFQNPPRNDQDAAMRWRAKALAVFLQLVQNREFRAWMGEHFARYLKVFRAGPYTPVIRGLFSDVFEKVLSMAEDDHHVGSHARLSTQFALGSSHQAPDAQWNIDHHDTFRAIPAYDMEQALLFHNEHRLKHPYVSHYVAQHHASVARQ